MKAPQFPSSRRGILLGSAAAAGLSVAPAFVRAQGTRRALKLSIGRIPWAAGNSPMSQYMINNKLMEKRAAEFGYDLSKYLVWIREQTKLRKESLGISKQNETLETTDGASKSSVARKRRGHPARVSA